MRLRLGLGLGDSRRPATSGSIPPTTPPGGGGGGGGGGFEGHETPPTVMVVEDTVVIQGKTKAGFVGRIVVPLGALVAGRTYNVNVASNLSGLALGGSKAGVGFGFKSGNSFRLELLQGNAGSTRLATITGVPPNGWNKNTGHTVTPHGAPTNGTQYAMDIQLAVNGDGDAYDFATSGDGQETWDTELADQSFAPFADITTIESGAAIAAYFSADDFGTYVITVTWVEEADADLWTPAEISTLLWLDANDAATFTLSGADVTAWNDKSGNANHFTQGTTGNKPDRDTVTNTIGGLPVVSFDETDDYLEQSGLSGWPANNGTAVTCVLVARKRGAFGANGAFWDISTGALTNTTALAFHGPGPGQGMNLRCTIISNAASSSAGSIDNNPTVWSFTVKSDKREIFKNGTVDGVNLTDNGTSAHTNMRIGRLFQDVFPFGGDVAEHVWVSGDTDATREIIEGYLAWKYGLEANLPGGHPYENAPPTI